MTELGHQIKVRLAPRRTGGGVVGEVVRGVPDVRGHAGRERQHDVAGMRHTCASQLIGQGVDLRVVMETLGHSQITLSANTYTHLRQAIQQEAAQRLDAVLSAG